MRISHATFVSWVDEPMNPFMSRRRRKETLINSREKVSLVTSTPTRPPSALRLYWDHERLVVAASPFAADESCAQRTARLHQIPVHGKPPPALLGRDAFHGVRAF